MRLDRRSSMQGLLSAPADGHTLIQLNSGMVVAQGVHKRHDLNRQLMPVTMSGETPMVPMVGGRSPHKLGCDPSGAVCTQG